MQLGRRNNPIYSDLPRPDPGPRDVDAMMAAAERWTLGMSRLLEEHGVERYQISYGVMEGSDVEWCDPSGCSTKLMDRDFRLRLNACLPDDLDLEDEADRVLEESGLGEYLYYDGWESGTCDSDNPNNWPKNFWYEHYRGEELHTTHDLEDLAYEARALKRKLLR